MNSKNGDIQSNLKKAEYAAKKAACTGSDILILPEFWTTGYDLPGLAKFSKNEFDRIIDKIRKKFSLWESRRKDIY